MTRANAPDFIPADEWDAAPDFIPASQWPTIDDARTGELGTLRRPGGGISTELSITVTEDALNSARPTNIPLLVRGQIGVDSLLAGKEPTAEQIAIAVRRAAERVGSGATLPSYGSIEEAVSVAKQRSESKSALADFDPLDYFQTMDESALGSRIEQPSATEVRRRILRATAILDAADQSYTLENVNSALERYGLPKESELPRLNVQMPNAEAAGAILGARLMPFGGAALDTVEAMSIRGPLGRFREGNASEQDAVQVMNFLEKQASIASRGRVEKIASTIGESLEFARDIAVTGGFGGVAKAMAGKGLVRGLAAGAKAAAVGTATRLPAFSPYVIAATTRNQALNGDGFLTALGKGTAETAISLASEQTGEILTAPFAAVAKLIPGIGRLKRLVFGTAYRRLGVSPERLSSALTRFGWSNIPAEMGEEEVEKLMRVALGEPYKLPKGNDLVDEAIAIGALGTALTGLSADAARVAQANPTQALEAARKSLAGEPVSRADLPGIPQARERAAIASEVAGAVRQAVQDQIAEQATLDRRTAAEVLADMPAPEGAPAHTEIMGQVLHLWNTNRNRAERMLKNGQPTKTNLRGVPGMDTRYAREAFLNYLRDIARPRPTKFSELDADKKRREREEDVFLEEYVRGLAQRPQPEPVAPPVDLDNLTWNELKAEARQREIPIKGGRVTIQRAVEQAIQQERDNAQQEQEAAQLHGDVQQRGGPQEGPRKVPAEESREGVREGRQGPQVQEVAPTPPGARPDLANIGQTSEQRALVDQVDIGRNERGEPIRIPLRQVYAEADAMLAGDYAGTRARVFDPNRTTPLDWIEERAARLIFDRESADAIRTMDPNALDEVRRLADIWRRGGAEWGRAGLMRRDPVATPAERAGRVAREAVLEPPQRVQRDIQEAEAAGNQKKADALRQQWYKAAKAHKELLRKAGYDLDTIDDWADDPVRMARFIGTLQTLKADVRDKLYEYWVNSILSAPTTQIVNIGGNLGFAAWHFTAERLAEATVNTVWRRKNAAQWGEFTRMLAAFLPALSRGWRNAVMTWRTETSWLQHETGRPIGSKIDTKGVAIKGRLGRVVRAFGYRMLSAADDFFATAIAHLEVAAQAYRIAKANGLSGEQMQIQMTQMVEDTTSAAWAEAIKEARRVTFRAELGTSGQKLMELRNSTPGARYIFPFVTTPVNIFRAGTVASPLGAFALAYRGARAIRTGNTAGLPAAIGQQLIAWAVLVALLNNDDDDPWITGAAVQQSPQERGLARRSFPPMSIKIGGRWYSYSRVEPFATALGLTVDLASSVRRGVSTARGISTVLNSYLGQLSSKTFLSGLGDIIEIARSEDYGRGPLEKAATWASSFAVSWVPNIARSAVRAARQEYPYRSAWSDGSEFYKMLGMRAAQRSEIFSPLVPDYPSRDIWGRAAQKASTGTPASDWIYNLVSPIEMRDIELFVGDRAIINWNNWHPEEPLYPRLPNKTFEFRNQRIVMTPKMYDEFIELAGTLAKERVGRYLKGKDITNPTRQMMDAIGNIRSSANTTARALLIRRWRESGEFGP